MTRIGIVGAGAAAAATAFTLQRTPEEFDITVLEKSRGLCGRAATRRRAGCRYDYGANYLKADNDRVVDLVTDTLDTDGLIDITDPIWTFDASGSIEPGRDADAHKWGYESGLTQIAKRLFARTEATVHRETRIEGVERREATAADGPHGNGTWHVTDTEGGEWGPFDALVLNPPAPQTATLLADADWAADEREALQAAVADVPYRAVYTAVCHYPFELETPYYALVNTDKAHDVGWIAREECKPGHIPDGESLLVIQAGHEWSVAHDDDPPERNVATLAARAADILEDDRLTEPDWTDHQGWRYALPEAGVDLEPVRAAEASGVYCIGDWVAGESRLHAALRNGLDTGERLAAASGTDHA